MSIPFLIYYLSLTKSQSNVYGKIIDFGATTDETGIHTFVIVKLENNTTVSISYDRASKFCIKKKVLVNIRTTKLFGIKIYKIKKWY